MSLEETMAAVQDEGIDEESTPTLSEEDVQSILDNDGAPEEDAPTDDEPKDDGIVVAGERFQDMQHLERSIQAILADLRAKDFQIAQMVKTSGRQGGSNQNAEAESRPSKQSVAIKAVMEAAALGPERFVQELLTQRQEIDDERMVERIRNVMRADLLPVLRPALAREQITRNPQFADVREDMDEIVFLMERGFSVEDASAFSRHMRSKAAPPVDNRVVNMPRRKKTALESAGSGVGGKSGKVAGKNFIDSMIADILG